MNHTDNYFDPKNLIGINSYFQVGKSALNYLYSGNHLTNSTGNNLEFSEYKQYNKGDDIKHIDWKVFARVDKLYIKKYDEESILNCALFIDNSNSMDYTSNENQLTKIEYAKFIAASIILKIIKKNDFVEVFSFNNIINKLSETNNNLSMINRLNDKFKNLDLENTTDLKKLIFKIKTSEFKKKLIIIISDLISDDLHWYDLHKMLSTVNNNVLLIHTLDKNEINLSMDKDSLVNFIDLETNKKIVSNPLKIQNTYNKIMQDYLKKLKINLNKNKLRYILVNTEVDLLKNLKRIFI